MKSIVLLTGATGSIGRTTLAELVSRADRFKVHAGDSL